MDWQALMSSEIFREYAKIELPKIAQKQQLQHKEEEKTIIDSFKQFEMLIKNNSKLKRHFKLAQEKLINDPDCFKNVDQNFINGLMLLDLDD